MVLEKIEAVHDYDIVVIGAGSPGVPAALAAAESGAKVAIIQKERHASACGHISAGIDVDHSDPVAVQKLVKRMMADNDDRSKRGLIESYVKHSGNALLWLYDKMKEAGVHVNELGNGPQQGLIEEEDLDLQFVTLLVGPKPYDVGDAMIALCQLAQQQGVDIYYNAPAVRLIKEQGRVTGVIARTVDGYQKFYASKGVILGTGDYQNDPAMMQQYLPDVAHFEKKKTGCTGDGHKMLIGIGGRMENVGHTKMVHDMDSGPSAMMSLPFLRVKLDGTRFVNEEVKMEYMNCYTLAEGGHYAQIFDDAYLEKAKDWAKKIPDKAELKNYMPEEPGEKKGVLVDQIATFKANSLEELAEKLQITDVETFKETVQRYNELVEAGKDVDFGVAPEHLSAIDTPPYYGTHRHVRFTQGCSGIVVNEYNQVLDVHDQPIEGVYAIGNLAGNFYGSIDYPLSIGGLNLGHNYTQGYVVGKMLAEQ